MSPAAASGSATPTLASASTADRQRGRFHDATYHAAVPRRPRRQLPAPEGAAGCARPATERRDHPRGPARGRGPCDPRRREVPGGAGAAGHHRRGVPAYLFPRGLPRAARGCRGAPGRDGQVPRRRGRGRLRAAGHARGGQAPPREADPAGGLRFPEVRDQADAQGHHPVADHAALSRRPAGDQQGGVSRPRGFLRRYQRLLPRGAEAARRGGLQVRPARRHQPRLPVRSEDARGRQGARRRSRLAAAPLRWPARAT